MTHTEQLARAASENKLWAVAQELALSGNEEALVISNLCSRIFEQTEREAHRLSRLAADLEASVHPDRSGQLHRIEVSAERRQDAQRFVARLQRDGYVGSDNVDGAAAESFFRHARQATLVRLEGTAFTVGVQWGKSKRASRVPRRLQPSSADHQFVDLPSKLWPAYLAVRPLRLASDRARRNARGSATFGPILSTPESLLGPLFDFAQVDASDHVVDLGCGDGRVILAAVQQRGCTATGVEKDPRLVGRAEQRLCDAGIEASDGQVVEGDAATFSTEDASVLFLFVPAEVVAGVVYQLRAEGFDGRILSHEQRYIPGGIRPTESKVLTGDDAVTIAHLWP